MFITMIDFLPKNLIALAHSLSSPLYIVGGFVRNFLIDKTISTDIDLAGNITLEELKDKISACQLSIVAEYKKTGTLVLSDGDRKYEFTAFRTEEYKGGEHTPFSTTFTSDILKDALRRDFKCNAVYYDIVNKKIVDPLGNGVENIKNKILDTVDTPEKVFMHDGLRLMRLARFAGELMFTPTEAVMLGAYKYRENIKEISGERIFSELLKILSSDTAYAFSDPKGHYLGLKILDETRVLDLILPELTDGRNMAQRADFHLYDVLEHSLRSVLHADKKVRLGALFHDIGKPFCFRRDGYYYAHFSEGEKIAERVLLRLKADKQTIKEIKFLVREHMVDLDCSLIINKVRRFIVKNHDRLEELMLVKQADFRASLEKHDIAPTLIKWDRIYKTMLTDGTPFTLKDLKISSKTLMEIGFKDKEIGKELNKLFDFAILNPTKNDSETLVNLATKDFKKIK